MPLCHYSTFWQLAACAVCAPADDVALVQDQRLQPLALQPLVLGAAALRLYKGNAICRIMFCAAARCCVSYTWDALLMRLAPSRSREAAATQLRPTIQFK
jgi:hypothetical protein